MAHEGLHEAAEDLSQETRDIHRALISLQEELEAVDWYRQRADACGDAHLKSILIHNMQEEMEHAAMLIEWMRRADSEFDTQLRTYLFTEAPITEVEEVAEAEESSPESAATVSVPTIGALKEKQ
ncbi:MAG: encapsulin-associated ferritin-like protein [Thiogranum sp.]|nr:encapsulin-associated ferritin-like protein [Thiogranum sp.]